MESTKYYYSLYQFLFAIVLFTGFMVFSVFMGIANLANYRFLILYGIFTLIIGLIIAYLCKKYFFPYLRKEIALELDNNRLHFFISKKTVDWKNINYINYLPGKSGMTIIFSLKDNTKDVRVLTNFVAGNDNQIRDTIEKYFQKNKLTDLGIN